MVSAIKRTGGIAALGLFTLASTCAWAGPVAGTCADVVATTPDAAASGPGMHASDVDDPPAVAFSIRDRMLLAEYRMLQRDRAPILLALDPRSEERRGGTEGVSTCRSRWSPDH